MQGIFEPIHDIISCVMASLYRVGKSICDEHGEKKSGVTTELI